MGGLYLAGRVPCDPDGAAELEHVLAALSPGTVVLEDSPARFARRLCEIDGPEACASRTALYVAHHPWAFPATVDRLVASEHDELLLLEPYFRGGRMGFGIDLGRLSPAAFRAWAAYEHAQHADRFDALAMLPLAEARRHALAEYDACASAYLSPGLAAAFGEEDEVVAGILACPGLAHPVLYLGTLEQIFGHPRLACRLRGAHAERLKLCDAKALSSPRRWSVLEDASRPPYFEHSKN